MQAVSASGLGYVASSTISDQPTGDPPSPEKVRELKKLIDSQMQNETRQHMLRSATRWHELMIQKKHITACCLRSCCKMYGHKWYIAKGRTTS